MLAAELGCILDLVMIIMMLFLLSSILMLLLFSILFFFLHTVFSCFVLFRPELVERWLMGIQRRAGTQTEPAAGAAIESDDHFDDDDYDARDDHQVQRQVQVTSSSL